jgi:hypothetical protein
MPKTRKKNNQTKKEKIEHVPERKNMSQTKPKGTMLELNPTEANRPTHDQLPLSETKLRYRSPTEHFPM